MKPTLLACILIFALSAPLLAQAKDTPVAVYVNGKLKSFDPAARVRDGVTYVPLRQGANALGFDVKWIAEQGMAQVCSETSCVMIPKKDGIIVNGSLFLPLRKMGEAMGSKVSWDAARKAVVIEKKKSGGFG